MGLSAWTITTSRTAAFPMKTFCLTSRRGARPCALLAFLALALSGCGVDFSSISVGSDGAEAKSLASAADAGAARATASAAATQAKAGEKAITNPILFVTQVPVASGDPFASRLSSFANHMPEMGASPRGGDLMIRYADGTLRNLTQEAGYGNTGFQGANSIAVREPTVHWSGTKAIFSMIVGSPVGQYDSVTSKWQLYEVTGLARGQTVRITKVANQPTGFNNVSPLYTSDDRILFTSDRPRRGEAHLYPNLDEYESTPTITGIYRLDPSTGTVAMLNHTPSGAYTPTIDSYGRVVFTRWDHLQRDQQQDGALTLGYTYDPINYSSEASNATSLGLVAETFPERRPLVNNPNSSSPYGQVTGYTSNLFTPWEMNQDGTAELTLNHIGRQELSFDYLPRTFVSDTSLRDTGNQSLFANRKYIRMDAGIFHIRESRVTPGTYYGIYAREFAQGTTNQIVKFTGAPSLNAEQMVFTDASPADTGGGLPGGRFRNPLPMSSGDMVASYSSAAEFGAGSTLRLHQLSTNASGLFTAGTALTPGISKTVWWWGASGRVDYSGPLWEIEAVEVAARTPPPLTASPAVETPEQAILTAEGVNVDVLRTWLRQNNLALIVTRNQTSRDRGDKQQPFNLRVPGGVSKTGDSGRVYDVAHYQIVQGNLVRAYRSFRGGRRIVAQPMTVPANTNVPNAAGPAGSVKIAADGSTAAFVPANRALSWQITDPSGEPVVRERVWVTLQAGEIRTCAGCHGENSRNQAGQASPTNQPQALRELIVHWKQATGLGSTRRRNGSAPLTPGG